MDTDMLLNKVLLFLFALLLFYTPLWAKEVKLQPSISVGLDYSDNISLTESNEEDDLILRVTPGIRFNKEGGRVKSNLNYSLSGLFHESSSDKDEIQHRLDATSNAEIIKHAIFLDVDAGISQELLDPDLSASYDGVSGSENLTETYTYGFSPYWQKKWDNFANSTLRYDYNELKYSGGDDDSTGESFKLDVSSGNAFDLITWALNYIHNETRYDDNSNTTSEIVKLVLGYHYSKQLQVRLTTGYEDYDSSYVDPEDGWAVGITWTPSVRTTLELDIGHRFYGDAYKLKFHHKGKKIKWNVSYDENITNQRNQIRENNQDRVDNPDNIIVPIATIQNQAELYLSRKLRNDLSYSDSKSTLKWGLYHEKKYYRDADNEDEDSYGTDVSWGWRIGKRTTMNSRASWRFYDDVISDDSQTRTELVLSLNRTITKNTFGFVHFSHRQNDADTKSNEYTENRVSLGLSKQF